jgi:hypothetical protein
VYSTYLGGSLIDTPVGVAIDPHGKALIAGYTSSKDFPTTTGAFESSCIPCDATSVLSYGSFVSEIDPGANGNASLLYSTYLNGSGHTNGNQYSTFLNSGNPLAVKVDGNDDLFVGGSQATVGFPVTPNSFQPACLGTFRCPSGFIVELNPRTAPANQLVYGTYLGGTTPISGSDAVTGLGLDAEGRIYAAGHTSSSDFLVSSDAAQPACLSCGLNSGGNAFLTVLDPTASGSNEMVYSTFLGGSVSDSATSLAVGALGLVAVGGSTYSSDFPTTANAVERTCLACRNPNILSFLNGDGFLAAVQF